MTAADLLGTERQPERKSASLGEAGYERACNPVVELIAKMLSGPFAPGDGHRETAKRVIEGLEKAGLVILPRAAVQADAWRKP